MDNSTAKYLIEKLESGSELTKGRIHRGLILPLFRMVAPFQFL